MNDDSADRFLRPLREKTNRVKDTSELFVRSLQLLESAKVLGNRLSLN